MESVPWESHRTLLEQICNAVGPGTLTREDRAAVYAAMIRLGQAETRLRQLEWVARILQSRDSDGLQCPKCGGRQIMVRRTIRTGSGIRRYRRCCRCGRRMTTFEWPYSRDPAVMSISSTPQPDAAPGN